MKSYILLTQQCDTYCGFAPKYSTEGKVLKSGIKCHQLVRLLRLLMQHNACFSFSYIRIMADTSSLVCALLGGRKSISMKLVFAQAGMQQVDHAGWSFDFYLCNYRFQEENSVNMHVFVWLRNGATLNFKHNILWNIYDPGLVTSCSLCVCGSRRDASRNLRVGETARGLHWDWRRIALQEYADWMLILRSNLNETCAWLRTADGKLIIKGKVWKCSLTDACRNGSCTCK